VLVDNGYLAWPTITLQYVKTMPLSQQVWSKMVESMRKDVEFTFETLNYVFVFKNVECGIIHQKLWINSGQLVAHFIMGF